MVKISSLPFRPCEDAGTKLGRLPDQRRDERALVVELCYRDKVEKISRVETLAGGPKADMRALVQGINICSTAVFFAVGHLEVLDFEIVASSPDRIRLRSFKWEKIVLPRSVMASLQSLSQSWSSN